MIVLIKNYEYGMYIVLVDYRIDFGIAIVLPIVCQ